MKVYMCNDHDSHYPVGCASVIVARNYVEARKLLDEQLVANGLRPYEERHYSLTQICLEIPTATILCNGNY